MIKFLLSSLFLFYPTLGKIHQISTSFVEIQSNLSEGKDFTLIYLFKPYCKPCVQNLSKLQAIKNGYNFKVILLTTAKENINILDKYNFDTCHYFNPLVYKTHTLDFDEFDQFTNEVFLNSKIVEPYNRIRFPAVFVFNKQGKLVYFNEDEYSTELEFQKIVNLK